MAGEPSAAPSLPRTVMGRLLVGRPRLFSSLLVALVTYAVEPQHVLPVTRLLIAWNVGTALYISLNLITMAQASEQSIRRRACITDEGRFVILVLVALAALASMGAIVVQLGLLKDLHGLGKGLHLALAVLTIVSAWVLIHLTFALHYAHEYFGPAGQGSTEVQGGIAFPGTDEPDYWDFLYFAFIIGVAAQTADVSITSKAIRLTSLGHSVVAFFFNSAILALTINIASGLI